ncbi:MAG TPA: 2-amino-4-hydroxy-6-hydroxymethyldihydropteridine diphosphokinase [Terracidiphilus sp.]|nr:2-amino-4-hydroxy-6-hydroxymethyldihydropteridine diphosphokinase [Terracidiphilus sp.]
MLTAYIGMGANLTGPAGPPEATLAAAAARLGALGCVARRSGLYLTTPVGYADQPQFVNAVVALETDLAPLSLLEALLAIEKEFGRDRHNSFANGPRTLDLDILLMGNLVLHEAELEIPHPRLAERAFALVPLNEIARGAVDPRHNRSVAALLDALTQQARGDIDGVARMESEIWGAGSAGVGAHAARCSGEPDADG